jgi:hypothetical protein
MKRNENTVARAVRGAVSFAKDQAHWDDGLVSAQSRKLLVHARLGLPDGERADEATSFFLEYPDGDVYVVEVTKV